MWTPRLGCCCARGAAPYNELALARTSVSMSAGACALEELLLPTYVWQRHAEMLPRATPPLALRLWNMGSASAVPLPRIAAAVQAASADATPEHAGGMGSGLAHVFAMKVPHMDFSQGRHMMQI
jgi:hypothetical protein